MPGQLAAPSYPQRTTSTNRQPSPFQTTRKYSHSYAADDVSSASDSDLDGDYQTDNTSPAQSENMTAGGHWEEVEDFRDREYPQLKGRVYLDHGGTTLYAKSLVEEFSRDMIQNLYGNPHSESLPSRVAGHRVDQVRERALRFFNADPEHFDLVFVPNATGAIKLVIECFKDHAAASNTPVWYGYHKDAHTSVVGIREATKLQRCFNSDDEVDLWIASGGLGGPRARQLGLFAYPGQSNMTGRRLPLSWPGRIRQSFHKAATYTLLDAAALASTAALDLSDPNTAPDFVALSFYKIFGFPNVGALIVRKDSAHVLSSRRYFGGGTVDMVIAVNDSWHAKKDISIHDRLEDGTLPFHSIFALDHAISVHERLYGPNPMKFISHHTAQLGKRLYDGLSSLQHGNGIPLCRIYKDENAIYGDPTMQGATVAFNVVRANGEMVGYADVEAAADERHIYVRSGALCNPGGVATYLNWSPAEMRAAYAAGHRCTNPTQLMLGKATGVVRVSLGAMSLASDVDALLHFLEETYVDNTRSEKPSLTTGPLKSPLTMPPMPPLTPPVLPDDNRPPSLSTSLGPSPWDASPRAQSAREKQTHFPHFASDYRLAHKASEDDIGRAANVSAREVDDTYTMRSGQVPNNGMGTTPSVKARKFGRSVVNLLRHKSTLPDLTKHEEMPPSPAIPQMAHGVKVG